MKFIIDRNSPVPLYRQIMNQVSDGVKSGALHNGDLLPSLNEFAASSGISMETAKKAYYALKRNGILSGRQGKGFYVDIRDSKAPKRILMLLDKLSASKLEIHKGFVESFSSPCEITINIHNQDIGLFEKMVTDSVGVYDYYLVAAHFPLNIRRQSIVRILRHIPVNRLILLDYELPEMKGYPGRVYQDFEHDAAGAIGAEIDLVRKYDRTIIIYSDNSLYGGVIAPGIRELLLSNGLGCTVTNKYKASQMTPGTLFIVLGSQLGNDHFTILREAAAKGYTLGKTIGLISYNDEPVNEFICGGLTCISSDFKQMGRTAAGMILSGRLRSVRNAFTMIKRSTL